MMEHHPCNCYRRDLADAIQAPLESADSLLINGEVILGGSDLSEPLREVRGADFISLSLLSLLNSVVEQKAPDGQIFLSFL